MALTRAARAGCLLSNKVTLADQHLALQQGVAQVLAESPVQAEAYSKILQELGQGLGWPLGIFWKVDRTANVLRCLDVWRSPANDSDEFSIACTQQTLAPGEGLPGAVWGSGAPTWISDISVDSQLPRMALAARAGYHAAVAWPVAVGKKVLGVIEFFSFEVREPDKALLRVLASLGRQIGLFFELKHAEEDLAERARLETLRADVGEALTGSEPLRNVLQECTEAFVRHLNAAFAHMDA